jgi:hypothetical protein
VAALHDDRAPLALAALAEVTDPESVGDLVEVAEPAEGVRDLIFACRLPGYAAWRWTVSTGQVEGEEPTVLEVELLPGEGALLAPPWVPWAERLAEYRRTHPDDEDLDDELDEDEDDEDDDEDLDDADLDPADDALEIDGVDFDEEAADAAPRTGGDEDAAEEVPEPAQPEDDADEPDEADSEHDGSDAAEAHERA